MTERLFELIDAESAASASVPNQISDMEFRVK